MEAQMDLMLSAEEARLLAQLLIGDKARLVEEINRTDKREFREFLRHRATTLDGVLNRLKEQDGFDTH